MAKNEIKIIVNNKVYSELVEIQIVRDLDYLSSSFECVVANRFIARSPIIIEDQIEIKVNEEPVLTGFVDNIRMSISNNSHNFIISGNDVTADLETSEIFANATYKVENLKSLCESTIQDNGIFYISVIDNLEDDSFDKDKEQSGDTGQTIFSMLSEYALKQGKILTCNGEGDMVIYSNSGISKGIVLENSSNNQLIKSANLSQDFSNRYKKIIVKSQSDDDSDISGEASDSVVRREITKVIINESKIDADGAKKIAEFEVNKRRSDSIQYNCKVFGFSAPNGELWKPNLLVSIIDSNAGINATMLLKRVRYNFSQSDGSTCDLTFVSEDAYSLKTEASQFNKGVE